MRVRIARLLLCGLLVAGASNCTIDKQTVSAMGQEIPLRSGMLVNADILLEKRSLLEWIFEPVLQLRGRL